MLNKWGLTGLFCFTWNNGTGTTGTYFSIIEDTDIQIPFHLRMNVPIVHITSFLTGDPPGVIWKEGRKNHYDALKIFFVTCPDAWKT